MIEIRKLQVKTPEPFIRAASVAEFNEYKRKKQKIKHKNTIRRLSNGNV